MVAERCHEVILGCSVEMLPLLKRVPGVVHAHHRWNEIPGHAAYCRLSSLPGLFHTTPNTIPAGIPYLAPDPARVAAWADRLSAQLPQGVKRVGLAWTGRPTHPNDRRRSLPLSRLAPLAAVHGHTFVSLQKPFPSADVDAARQFPGLDDMSSILTDFEETAAIIANLDLVITVDTSMGHLAGALGKPVWILLSKASDWRWLIDREDTPWYPTARLFRQSEPGAWAPVVDAVAAALSAAHKPRASNIAAE
jgi:hypothetical protein